MKTLLVSSIILSSIGFSSIAVARDVFTCTLYKRGKSQRIFLDQNHAEYTRVETQTFRGTRAKSIVQGDDFQATVTYTKAEGARGAEKIVAIYHPIDDSGRPDPEAWPLLEIKTEGRSLLQKGYLTPYQTTLWIELWCEPNQIRDGGS